MEKKKIGIAGIGYVGGALNSYFQKKEDCEVFHNVLHKPELSCSIISAPTGSNINPRGRLVNKIKKVLDNCLEELGNLITKD